VAKGVGPEFKPQYYKKKKEEGKVGYRYFTNKETLRIVFLVLKTNKSIIALYLHSPRLSL
jgi:hypothetical protein